MTRIPALPRGITGFAPERTPLPWIDVGLYKKMCYAAANAIGAHVTQVVSAEGQVARNFHVVEMEVEGTRLLVLGNAHYPWLALAEPGPVLSGLPPIFAGWWQGSARLVHALQAHPAVVVLDPAALEQWPTPELLRELSDTEVRQVRGWKPQRLGDIVFNTWD